ncbi:MAG: hypothetical protein HYU67_11170 [Flavobacteriia bacterium]|nr:hypothetical protein [Flavobacteriia bacterium]
MYNLFQEKMELFCVFTNKDIEKEFPKFDKKNLVYWQKKNYIKKIRNNYYYFSKNELSDEFLFFVANKIYHPSYISLESSLSYYSVIPESVFTSTSVSTLKTNHFSTLIGIFSYNNIKENLFFGYTLIQYKNHFFKLANLEKTVLDYLYLHPEIAAKNDFDSLRWNKEVLKKINFKRLSDYQILFNSNALNLRIKRLIEYIHA